MNMLVHERERQTWDRAIRRMERWGSLLHRSRWSSLVAGYKYRYRLSRDEQQHRARRDLASLLQYAYRYVPLHGLRMMRAGVDPWHDSPELVLGALPTISRLDIRAHAEDLRSPIYPSHRVRQFRTGGTTSVPLPYFQDDYAILNKNAMSDALRACMGWQRHDRVAFLWGAAQDLPQGARKGLRQLKHVLKSRLVDHALYLSAASMDDAILREHIRKIDAFRPRVMQAYGSAADLLARYLLAADRRLNVPLVVLTAEQIFEDQRARVAREFNANVLTFYGSRELGWIAEECPTHHRLHINTAGVWLETSDRGELIATDLHNRAMPFIRYRTGDMGTLCNAPCPCGNPRPVLKSLTGRTTDVFIMPSGTRVLGCAIDVRGVSHMGQGILDAQIVQRELTALDVYFVPGPRYEPHHRMALHNRLHAFCGGEVDVRMHEVVRLQPDSNGKVRYAKCLVPPPPVAAVDDARNA